MAKIQRCLSVLIYAVIEVTEWIGTETILSCNSSPDWLHITVMLMIWVNLNFYFLKILMHESYSK